MTEHLLRGTFRNDRHGAALHNANGAPQAGADSLDPESLARLGAGLGAAGRRLVEDHLAGFARWDPTSLKYLRTAAEAADRVEEIRKQIADDGGVMITGARGRRMPHPLLPAERRAASQLLAALRAIDFDAAAPASAKSSRPALPPAAIALFPLKRREG